LIQSDPNRNEDEDEDEEEEDEDEDHDEEYGDDFNENFVVGYEHIEPVAGANRGSSSSSNTGAVNAINEREAM
jgi:hypothetical protein